MMKCGISDSKAKSTFEATTKMCVRLAVLPLSRRKWTDLLSLRSSQIKMHYFTDNLFAGVK